MAVPEIVLDLVQRFEENRDVYISSEYKEAHLRHEFLDPFFEALGWDVYNKQGYAEAYKDIVVEDAIKVGGATKAPDYAFRIGGTRKFFVEAKAASTNIKGDISPAFQLRRYAWSAKLPLSILTDFEEFAVYDCRSKPDKTDRPSTGRVLYLKFDEYIDKWDDITSVFSRQAVLKGSFDRYAKSTRGKHGTAEVDDAFLAEIERWRDLLAHNIALRNPQLNQRELNYAVQMTIDRLIFLRICEDRGIEFYGQLQALLNCKDIYARLGHLFRKADERYNSGMFHFRTEKDRDDLPDNLTLSLLIDDKPLKDIIANVYYPDSPYEFSVVPADILGQVYEQFLGKVIRLTPGHRAVIEEKPEVRKAGGVFYTPTYIVEYIVSQTVGKLLEGKKPGDRGVGSKGAPIRILDPACGSGSFLLGAYQYLLDWYRDGYLADGAEKWAKGRNPKIYPGSGGEWKLTTSERKRILLDHIYGVDIDPQAVEVTKLSLLLKVLEGENEQTLAQQLSFWRERALPDLGANIKCGNSLIGPDFYAGQQMSYLDVEERYRVNAFDWAAEYPQVFASDDNPGGSGIGFDAVIGNPPYIRMENFKELKNYLKANYASHDERSDLYAYFIERGHRLLRDRGKFGMIVSNKFFRANYGRPFREFINQQATVEQVVDFAGLPVFRGATVRTIVLLTHLGKSETQSIRYVPPLPIARFNNVENRLMSVEQSTRDLAYEVLEATLHQPIWNFLKEDSSELLQRLQSVCQPLGAYCDGQIYMGVKSGLTEAFVIDDRRRKEIIIDNPQADEIIKPFLNGRDIRRYHIQYKQSYLIYTYHGVDIARFPAIEKHLKPFKDRLNKRATRQEWYRLQQPQLRFKPYLDSVKIIFPDIATSPRFALDETGCYGSNTIYFIPSRDLYLLGLLNSRLGFYYFRSVCAGLEGKTETYLRFFGQYLEGFPVHVINSSSPADYTRHDHLVSLVEQMLNLHRKLDAASTPAEQTMIKRQIESIDRQIDLLVYELYGLTDEEIKIVEGK